MLLVVIVAAVGTMFGPTVARSAFSGIESSRADNHMVEVGSPEVELNGTRTIMKGARYCDSRYCMKTTKGRSRVPSNRGLEPAARATGRRCAAATELRAADGGKNEKRECYPEGSPPRD
jgi:hypothetical protein